LTLLVYYKFLSTYCPSASSDFDMHYTNNSSTNAIKFTKDRPQREITVTIGGSWTRPPKCWQDVTFTDDDQPKIDITENAEWGNGKRAYLWLRVRDTGCGMTHDEQKKLFSRFSQATPRTHISYGGSGTSVSLSSPIRC
jgi:signal transduction histidine kinase